MRIIIAIDGSEFSDAAVAKYCSAFAGKYDEVKILTVVEPMTHIVGAPFGVVDEYYNTYIKEARNEAAGNLDKARSMLSDCLKGDQNISTELVIGSPSQAVVETAAEWNADLIVMGSHGRGFWQRLYLGSVSNSVVHNAPCSVLVVRGQGFGPTTLEQQQ